MKNFYKIIFVLFICFFVSKSFAQELSDANTLLIQKYFQLNNNTSAQDVDKSTFNNYVNKAYNVVSINQVGSNNYINSKGNVNDSQQISQKGINNSYEYINYYSSLPSNFIVNQIGNSNSLEIYGENSLVKNLQVTQKANNQSLIIKNY